MWSSWRTKTVFNRTEYANMNTFTVLKPGHIVEDHTRTCKSKRNWTFHRYGFQLRHSLALIEYSTDTVFKLKNFFFLGGEGVKSRPVTQSSGHYAVVSLPTHWEEFATHEPLHAKIVPGAQVIWFTNQMTWKLWDRLRTNTLSLLSSSQPPRPPPIRCSTVTLTEASNTSQKGVLRFEAGQTIFSWHTQCIEGHMTSPQVNGLQTCD